MKRLTILIVVSIMSASTVYADNFTDSLMEKFLKHVKVENYEKAIESVVKGSLLEEKVLAVTQTKETWIRQFQIIRSAYGEYQEYEAVYTLKLGRLRKVYYLVYCKDYPIKVEIAYYITEDKRNVVQFNFNDESIDLLERYGEKVESY